MTTRTTAFPEYVRIFVEALRQRTTLHIEVMKHKHIDHDRAYIVRGFQNANHAEDSKECLALSFSRTENEDPLDKKHYVYLDRLKFPLQARTGCTVGGTELLLAVLSVCDDPKYPFICFVEDASALFIKRQQNSLFLPMRWLYLLGSGQSWYGKYGFEIDPLYADAVGQQGEEVLAFGAELKREKKKSAIFTYDAINTKRVKQRIVHLAAPTAVINAIREYAKVLQAACTRLGLQVPFTAIREAGQRWTVAHTDAFMQRYSLQSLGKATNYFINHVPETVPGSDEHKSIALVVRHFKGLCKRLTATATPLLYDAIYYMRKPRTAVIDTTVSWKLGAYTASDQSSDEAVLDEAVLDEAVLDEARVPQHRGKALLAKELVAKARALHKQTRKRAQDKAFPVFDFPPTESYDGDSEHSSDRGSDHSSMLRQTRQTRKKKVQAK